MLAAPARVSTLISVLLSIGMAGLCAGQLSSCTGATLKKKHPFNNDAYSRKVQINAGESITFSDEGGSDEYESQLSPASTVSIRPKPAGLGKVKQGQSSVSLETTPGIAARGKIQVTRHYRLYEDSNATIELEVLLPDSPWEVEELRDWPQAPYYASNLLLLDVENRLLGMQPDNISWPRSWKLRDLEGDYSPALLEDLEVGSYPQVCVRDEGEVLLAAEPNFSGQISFYRCTATGTEKETVASGSLMQGARPRPLQLDSQGRVHLVYRSGETGSRDLMYAWRDTAGWQTQLVDTDIDAPSGDTHGSAVCALGLDGKEQPNIVYVHSPSRSLRLAVLEAGKWRFETLRETNPMFGSFVLGFDNAGSPMVLFGIRDTERGLLVRSGDGWRTIQLPPRSATVDYQPDTYGVQLSCDAKDRPCMLYMTDPNIGKARLRLARYEQADWQSWTISEAGECFDAVLGQDSESTFVYFVRSNVEVGWPAHLYRARLLL